MFGHARFDLARNRVGDRGALSLAAVLPKCGQLQVGNSLGNCRHVGSESLSSMQFEVQSVQIWYILVYTWYRFGTYLVHLGSAMFSLVPRLTESQRLTETRRDSQRLTTIRNVQGLRPGWPRGRGDPRWRSDWWQPEIYAKPMGL